MHTFNKRGVIQSFLTKLLTPLCKPICNPLCERHALVCMFSLSCGTCQVIYAVIIYISHMSLYPVHLCANHPTDHLEHRMFVIWAKLLLEFFQSINNCILFVAEVLWHQMEATVSNPVAVGVKTNFAWNNAKFFSVLYCRIKCEHFVKSLRFFVVRTVYQRYS